MDNPKCKNLKEAVNFLLDKSKQDGFTERETAKLLQDFLADLLSGKVGFFKVGFFNNKMHYKPDDN